MICLYRAEKFPMNFSEYGTDVGIGLASKTENRWSFNVIAERPEAMHLSVRQLSDAIVNVTLRLTVVKQFPASVILPKCLLQARLDFRNSFSPGCYWITLDVGSSV